MIFLAAAPVIAIVGATVYETPDQKVDDATIVIDGGRITAIGADVKVPQGATTIDGKDKIVTAGLIDADSSVGLVDIDLEPSDNDGRLTTSTGDDDAIHAAYRVIDGYDGDALTVPVARTGGVTSVVSLPGGDLVGGQGAWLTLADGGTADDAVLAPAALQVTLGSDANTVSGASRGRAIEMLRDLLDDAADYAAHKGAYEKNQSRKLSASRGDLEALAPVLRGKLPLVVTARSEHDIRAVLRLAREKKIRVVIAGGDEAWKVAKQLAKQKVPVILDPWQNEPARLEAPDVRDDAAAVLAKAGVAVAISTLGDGANQRTLRQRAGDAVGDDLPWASALAAITTVPAAIYGVARGSLAKGAVADLVVWSGDPLEIATRAETVIIGGVVQPLETHQTELLKRYR